jgi:hypothetical protein
LRKESFRSSICSSARPVTSLYTPVSENKEEPEIRRLQKENSKRVLPEGYIYGKPNTMTEEPQCAPVQEQEQYIFVYKIKLSLFLRREKICSHRNHCREQIQTISVVRLKMPKGAVVFCLKLPFWIVVGTTDHMEETLQLG